MFTQSVYVSLKKSSLKKNIYYLPKNICLQDSRLNFFHPKSWGFSTAFGYIHCQREQKTALLSRGQKNIYIYFSKNTCTYSNRNAAHISRIDCAWK